jgi:recombination protein U
MKDTRMANRGREFEELIDAANEWYKSKGIGLIQKVPTEWRILRAYDERTKRQKIISAFPVRKSTVDYIGLFYNRPIAFDAKSTENKTRFPLKNIEEHQREFLEFWRSLGGKAFYLVNFKVHKQIFIITSYQLNKFIETEDRASIPLEFFQKKCLEAHQDGTNPLHYLKEMF